MYIIIQNECIDTSIFQEMKLYSYCGIIAFIYRNPQDGRMIELPITFDEDFDAEFTYDDIIDNLECGAKSYVSKFYASVPSGLLTRMKRGLGIPAPVFKKYEFMQGTEEAISKD